jgi:tetratricopeptide (TPR) repeat protein
MPTWVIGIDNTDLLVESAEGRAIARQFANRALGFLEGSRVYHEQNPKIYIEEAMILWRKASDLDGAVGRFEQAIRAESPPYYAYRVYGELLVKLGRKEEALKLLESHYETLPDDSIEAMKPVVADRIRNLRRELGY